MPDLTWEIVKICHNNSVKNEHIKCLKGLDSKGVSVVKLQLGG